MQFNVFFWTPCVQIYEAKRPLEALPTVLPQSGNGAHYSTLVGRCLFSPSPFLGIWGRGGRGEWCPQEAFGRLQVAGIGFIKWETVPLLLFAKNHLPKDLSKIIRLVIWKKRKTYLCGKRLNETRPLTAVQTWLVRRRPFLGKTK